MLPPSPTSELGTGSNGLERLRARVPLFTDLTDTELAIVLKSGSQRELYDDRQVVFREGTPGTSMFIILSGRVRITRSLGTMGEEELAVLQSGECFGEMGLIDPAPRSARATSAGSTTLLKLNRQSLDHLSGVLAYKIISNFATILVARLRGANEQLARLATHEREQVSRIQELLEKQPDRLAGVNLQDGELRDVDLHGADMRCAQLDRARLRSVRLSRADLRGADLRNAHLADCDLRHADLRGADLRGADFKGTNFANARFAEGAGSVETDLGVQPAEFEDE